MKRTNRSKKIAALLCAGALAVASVAALSGCMFGIVTNTEAPQNGNCSLPAGSTITDGVLTVGINASAVPYGGSNSSGDTVGLDVDIAAALADELGCSVQIVDVTNKGVNAVETGTVDIAMGISRAQATENIAFSSAYLNDGLSLFCLEDNDPESIMNVDLASAKVIVQKGTAAATTVTEAIGGEHVVLCDSAEACFEALQRAEAPYVVIDAVVGDYYAAQYSDVMRVNYLAASTVTPLYIITKASNANLTVAIKDALTNITSGGALRIVMSKWCGNDAPSLMPGRIVLTDLPATFPEEPEDEEEGEEGDEEGAQQA